jgi:aminoglycoside/choline kinase family phosphotransferase
MGLQRHLKAIGIFSRLHLRDGKPNYLNDIPRTLNYVATVSAAYPEFADFNSFLHNHVLPAYGKLSLPRNESAQQKFITT